MKPFSILVVEDDPKIRRFLKISLEGHGYRFLEAVSGAEGLLNAAQENPDVLILDLGLPDKDGQEFLKEFREWSDVPVIVLTARDQDQDKIQALDSGADDYLIKPFSIGELLARIRVALRHKKGEHKTTFETGRLRIDHAKRQVFVGDDEIHLTPIEYKILLFLTKHADKVVTQQQLLKEVWGPVYSEQTNNLRFHIHQLRHKLEENPAQPKWLINEPGVGYRFKLENI